MKEFSLLIIKILTYQPNGEQIIIEWLLTIGFLIFLMVALFKILKIVKKAFRDSLYSGDDEYISDDLERDRSDSDIDDVLNKYYGDGAEV